MARTRHRIYDSERTEQLALDELFVEKIPEQSSNMVVWNQSSPPHRCPYCGCSALKTHNHFTKNYLDLLPGESTPRTLEYNFYKYRCLNPACKKIFAIPIEFATVNDRVTHRLENQIVQWIIEGNAYRQIVEKLHEQLTQPAVGQILNRWVKEKGASRRVSSPPSKLAVISGALNWNHESYAAFLNLDDGIRIFDIVFRPGSSDIYSVLNQIGLEHIKLILSDCNPIITGAILGCCPKTPYVIPVDYWFEMVARDFQKFSHEIISGSQVPDKYNLIMLQPDTLGSFRADSLDRLFRDRPNIIKPHQSYNSLRKIISRRDEMWIFKELEDWVDALDSAMKDGLQPSILSLHELQKPIEEQLHYRDEIPDRLYYMTSRLEELLSEKQFRTFSDEILKARVLYSTKNSLAHWTGAPIQDVISALQSKIWQNTEEEKYV